jgi:hypothetical protein
VADPKPAPNASPQGPLEKRDEAVKRLAQANVQAGGSSADPKDPLVYLGKTRTVAGLSDADALRAEKDVLKLPEVDNVMPLSQVGGQYYTWDQKTKDQFLTQVALTGVDVTGLTDGEMAKLWASYSAQAAGYYANGQTVTPWDILAKDRKQREAFMKTPRTVTQTSTDLDVSSALSSRALFQQAAHALLGRDPTKGELRSFQDRLNAYEKANPRVTTTTTNYVGSDVTGQSSTTVGGVKAEDRAMMAEDLAKADPEYGAYQAATNGMNWLMEMVGGGR